MSVHIETLLLDEASNIAGRQISSDEELHELFNINKLLTFIQNIHCKLDTELNVNSLYISKTVGALAKAIDQDRHNSVPKLLQIKDGDKRRPLIIFAGGVSCFLEIKHILNGLSEDCAVFGMNLTRFNKPRTDPAVVADEVNACMDELERQGISGPVSLLGYSFGGIFALELARALRANGKKVEFLGLIDTPQSEHAWPMLTWGGFLLHRIRRKTRRIAYGLRAVGKKPVSGSKSACKPRERPFLYRLRPILFRFCHPSIRGYPELAPEWVDGNTPDYECAGRQLLRMKGLYRPSVYDGDLVFYRAKGGSPNDCDPRKIWARYLPNAKWVDVRGNHLSVIVGKNGETIGRDISRRMSEFNSEVCPS
ncbi:MAG: thioesterase domain-containing protein [Pseudomonadota bacterium]